MRSRAILILAVVIGTFAATTQAARPVAADCNPEGADLSFARAVPLAERVVIGTVIEVRPDGSGSLPTEPSSRFTLAVSHVLRGDAPDVMAFDFLPTQGCIRWVAAAVGDQIALALDVRAADPPIASNTAAWIAPIRADLSFDSITVRQVVRLVRRGPPDTATVTAAEPAPRDDVPWTSLVAVAAGASTLVLTLRRRRLGVRA